MRVLLNVLGSKPTQTFFFLISCLLCLGNNIIYNIYIIFRRHFVSSNKNSIMPRPRGCQELTSAQRGEIIGRAFHGQNLSEIARELGCNRKTVKKWLDRQQDDGAEWAKSRQRSGRPRATTAAQDEALVQDVTDHPLRHRSVLLDKALEYGCSHETIRHRLKEVGLSNFRPATKTFLTVEHKARRLEWAQRNIELPQDYWNLVVWTDEKVFRSDQQGKVFLYRPRGTRFEPQYVVRNEHSGRITAHFWAYMTAAGPGELIPVAERMNSAVYTALLENTLLPSLRANFPDQEEFIVMHDNSAVHTSRHTQTWLERHPEIICLDWPPRSPDLNPIEHVWGFMVQEWEKRREDRVQEVLQAHVMELWQHYQQNPGRCSALVANMQERLRDVIHNQGDFTRF